MAKRRRPPPPRSLESYAPLRTFLQIVGIQTSYYAAFLIITLFTSIVAGLRFSLDYIFDWHSIRIDNTLGWTLGLVWVLCALVLVIAITLLVSRSKLVLDFALTAHFLHFLLVSFYSHAIPRNSVWWAALGLSALGTILLANWTCQRRELRPIPFSGLDGGRRRNGDYEMVAVEEGRAEGRPD